MNKSQRFLLALLCLLPMAARLWVAWWPAEALARDMTADDAYYYLKIAQHMAQGKGSTFDGLHPTNGFHPLYMLLLIPLAAVSPPGVLLHVALTLLALCEALVATLIYTWVKHDFGVRAARLAALLWLWNPWVAATTLKGVESAVYGLGIGLTLLIFSRQRQKLRAGAPRAMALLGLSTGITVLGRTDAVFLGLALAVSLLWQWARARAASPGRLLLGVAAGAALFVAVTGPWWMWNLVNFNSIMQASGQAALLGRTPRPGLSNPILTARLALDALQDHMRLLIGETIPLLIIIVLWLLSARRSLKADWRTLAPLAPAFLYVSFLGVWYSFIFLHLQRWYLYPLLLVLSAFAGGCLDQLMARLKRVSETGVWLSIAAIMLLVTVTEAQLVGFGYPRQRGGYALAQWLKANLPMESRIAAWNAGVIGYYSDRTIVNLDGVVNNVAIARGVIGYQATPDMLFAYLQEEGVTFLADYEMIPTLPASWQGYVTLLHAFADSPARVYRLK